jgi:hypothetical protein
VCAMHGCSSVLEFKFVFAAFCMAEVWPVGVGYLPITGNPFSRRHWQRSRFSGTFGVGP